MKKLISHRLLTTVTSQAVEHFRYHTPRSYLEKIEETKSMNHEPSIYIVSNLLLFLFFLLFIALLLLAFLLVFVFLVFLVFLLILVLILVVILLWFGVLMEVFLNQIFRKLKKIIFTKHYMKMIME